MTSYGIYMSKESPKRGSNFYQLALTLGLYSHEATVTSAKMLEYLGKPDLIAGTVDAGSMVYFYKVDGVTNTGAVYAFFKAGSVTNIGFGEGTVNDHSGYKAYTPQ
jgi:hypothetical protein